MKNFSILLALGIAAVWGGAFYVLGTYYSVALGLLAAASLIFFARSSYFKIRDIYLVFVAAHLLGFAWVLPSTHLYFRTSMVFSLLGLLAFAAYGALQFLLFTVLVRLLAKSPLRRVSLDVALSWCTIELLFFKPIDWYLAHTFTTVPLLIQSADMWGAPGVGLLFVWIITLAFDAQRDGRVKAIYATLLLGLTLAYGQYKINEYSFKESQSFKALIVQDVAAPMLKYDEATALHIAQGYGALTRTQSQTKADLILWPESSVIEPFPDYDEAKQRVRSQEIGFPEHTPLLFGTIRTDEMQNSSNTIAMRPADSNVLSFYDKGVPFPIAEGNPFLAIFYPEVSSPRSLDTFEIPTVTGPVRILPVICFESTIAKYVAMRALRAKPNMIVEFSNVNWFYGTTAARQHEIISLWRSIENRMPLLRVVNGGPSSLIESQGIIATRIPPGDRAAVEVTVPIRTPAPTIFQHIHSYLLVCLLFIIVASGYAQLSLAVRDVQRSLRRLKKYSSYAKATVLTAVGLTCSVGTVFHWPVLVSAGLTMGVSPHPFVFNMFEGINYWAHDISIDLLGKKLAHSHHQITANLFSQLPGPHLYHMAYTVPFAFAPVYPREYWEPVLQAAFCGEGGKPGSLLPLFHFEQELASLKLTIKERYPASGDTPRTWEYRVVCRDNQ